MFTLCHTLNLAKMTKTVRKLVFDFEIPQFLCRERILALNCLTFGIFLWHLNRTGKDPNYIFGGKP